MRCTCSTCSGRSTVVLDSSSISANAVLPAPSVTVNACIQKTSSRASPGSGPGTSSWFRQDRPLFQRLLSWSRDYAATDVVTSFLELFHEVEEFWARGTIGPHIRFLPVPKEAKEWVKNV